MAYTKEIIHRCPDCKTREVRVEVFTFRNEGIGQYCRLCGKHRLKRQEQIEEEMFAEARA